MESNKKPKKTKEDAPQHCKAEKFTTKVVLRSQLKGAPYNPRTLTEEARAKLRKSLSTVGLVMPIVWNETSGNIVGGHQRLRELDSIQGSPDYTLTVAAVSVDEKTEKELNVFLNNTNAQGDWDLEKLKELLSDESIDKGNTGFDMADIFQMFGEMPDNSGEEAVEQIAESMQKLKDAYDELREKMALKDDTDFYNVLIFESNAERAQLAEILQVEDNRYIDGKKFLELAQKVLGNGANARIGNEGNGSFEANGILEDKPEIADEPR